MLAGALLHQHLSQELRERYRATLMVLRRADDNAGTNLDRVLGYKESPRVAAVVCNCYAGLGFFDLPADPKATLPSIPGELAGNWVNRVP